MSVFNGGDYLSLAVKSIINQSYKDWELIIIDDGSTDGSVDILQSLNDARIIIVQDRENKGLSARLNQAIDMVRGRYLARMDHDDISHPNRLDEQVTYLEKHPNIDLVATKCITINESNQPMGSLPFASKHKDICVRPWMGFPMPHPSWMGRTSWFRCHYYKDPAPFCCEDNELLLRTYGISHFHAIDLELLAYRVREYNSLNKLIKTRYAMGMGQINYFLKSKKLIDAILSCFAMILRIIKDLVGELKYLVLPLRQKKKCSESVWLNDVLAMNSNFNP